MKQIGHEIDTQDNRCTMNPIFCVRQEVVVQGLSPEYATNFEWVDPDYHDVVDEDTHGAVKVGTFTYLEVVMTAFTEKGCEEYLRLNGHNLNNPHIYVDSFNRCPEMMAIREYLICNK